MRKKVPVLLLAAVTAAAILTGCGSAAQPVPTPAPTQTVKETPQPVRVEETTFPNGEKELYAKIYRPAEEKDKYPAVIISHGFAGSYADNAGRAEYFAQNGFLAVAFDFYGGNRTSKSGGEMKEMSVLTEAEDLNAMMDGVSALPDVDASQLFLLGCSQGGFVSAYVAAQRPEDVKALVLLYPAFSLQDDCWERHGSVENIPEEETVMNQTLGAIYSQDAMSIDIYEVIGGYKGDVLIHHGDIDEVVDLSYSERAAEVYENAELVVIRYGDHGFHQGKTLKQSNEGVLEFLKAHVE